MHPSTDIQLVTGGGGRFRPLAGVVRQEHTYPSDVLPGVTT